MMCIDDELKAEHINILKANLDYAYHIMVNMYGKEPEAEEGCEQLNQELTLSDIINASSTITKYLGIKITAQDLFRPDGIQNRVEKKAPALDQAFLSLTISSNLTEPTARSILDFYDKIGGGNILEFMRKNEDKNVLLYSNMGAEIITLDDFRN